MDQQAVNLPDVLRQLSAFKRESVKSLAALLQTDPAVSAVLLGGSLSYKTDLEKSDVDLFCLVEHPGEFEARLPEFSRQVPELDVVLAQGSFAWTGKLYTLYFKADLDFSIDLCLIALADATTFFWEPEGHILFDKAGLIGANRQSQLSRPDYTRQPFLKPNPFSLAVMTLKKIEKNITRGHLWNALEMLHIFRRYIMQILRLQVIGHDHFLGRVDRDIEDVLPSELHRRLAETAAAYDVTDIVGKTILLIELLSDHLAYLQDSGEEQFADWISRQLQQEKSKLNQHLIYA